MDLSGRDIGTVKIVNVEDEMRVAYLDYAMSVITSRALPDARDGLKPVQRRILYAMHETGLRSNASYSKSAATVGEVMKHYHPHGDAPIYDALVRMAQPFSMRYPLIDGQGNFGSVDDDPPAAMRYTEARMTALAEQMLADIEKNTVDFQPNYDSKTQEPTVLPSRVPNLLVNGASGIAVGMATNIPPHNLGEICDGLIHLIDHPDATIEDLMKFVKGPDFPTAGIIMGLDGIKSAFSTGHGRIVCQARAHIEELERGRFQIVVTELPYQVNKAALQAKIAELVKAKKDGLEAITEIRDESDRQGMRVVIELRRDAQPRAVLNNLYKHTAMRQAFSVNALALVNGQPRVLTLKLALQQFLQFRQEVVTRRSQFELEKARERAHVLEGLKVALDHLDAVIRLIRGAESAEAARTGLMERFKLTEIQAQAILDMQLRRLAALERQKILDELAEIQDTIRRLEELLSSPAKILGVVKDELKELKQKFGDPRRTIIIEREAGNFTDEDLIPEQSCLVSITGRGYIKRVPTDTFRPQRRGTRGLTGMVTRESDTVRHLLVASTHDHLLFFTNRGRVFQLKTYEIPESSRTSKGVPIINLISIEPNEVVTAVVVRAADSAGKFLTMITRRGEVKKTAAEEFGVVRSSGLIAMDIEPGDELVFAKLVSNDDTMLLFSKKGQAIRFPVRDLRSASRQSGGVRGMRLAKDDEIAGADVAIEPREALIVTKLGLGKRTRLHEFPVHNRGGQGVRAINVTARTGQVAAARIVDPNHDVMIISAQGIVVRMPISTISRQGRAARGVTVMRVQPGDEVVAMAIVDPNGRGPGGGNNGKVDDPLLGQPELFAVDSVDDDQGDGALEDATEEATEQRLRRVSATRSRTGGTIRVQEPETATTEAAPKAKRSRKAAAPEVPEAPSAEVEAPPASKRARVNGKATNGNLATAEVVSDLASVHVEQPAKPRSRGKTARAASDAAPATAEPAADSVTGVSEEAPAPKVAKRSTRKAETSAEPAEATVAVAKPTKRRQSKAADTAEATPAPADVVAADKVPADSVPVETPKRRRTTKKQAAETSKVAEASSEAEAPAKRSARARGAQPATDASTSSVAETDTAVELAPPRPTRKRASSKAAEPPTDGAVVPAGVTPVEDAPAAPVTAEAPASRRTRSARTKAAEPAANVIETTSEMPPAPQPSPVRPSRSRATKAAEPTTGDVASVAAPEDSTAKVETVEAAPKRRRRSAPQPVPVASESTVEAVAEPAIVESPEPQAAEAEAPRKSRRRGRSAAQKQEAVAAVEPRTVTPAGVEVEAPEPTTPQAEPSSGRSRRRRRSNRRGPSAAPPGGGSQSNGRQPHPQDQRGGRPRGDQRWGQGQRQQQPRRGGGGQRGAQGYQDPLYGTRSMGYASGPGRNYVGSKHANLPTSGTRPITRLAPQRSSYPGQPGGQLGWPYGGQRQRPANPWQGGGQGSGRGSNRGGRGQQQGGRQGGQGPSQGQGRRKSRNKRSDR